MFDARQIANWFVLRAQKDGRRLSVMQILKLVYIAHGWHLEMRGAPLFHNKIEAWRHGPVIPDVYHAFRAQGVTIAAPVDGYPSDDFPPEYDEFLGEIYRLYGSMGAFKLSKVTHEEGGPWHIATKSRGLFAPISNEIIRAHYVGKRNSLAPVNG